MSCGLLPCLGWEDHLISISPSRSRWAHFPFHRFPSVTGQCCWKQVLPFTNTLLPWSMKGTPGPILFFVAGSLPLLEEAPTRPFGFLFDLPTPNQAVPFGSGRNP